MAYSCSWSTCLLPPQPKRGGVHDHVALWSALAELCPLTPDTQHRPIPTGSGRVTTDLGSSSPRTRGETEGQLANGWEALSLNACQEAESP